MVDESMLTSETAEQLAQLDERKISLFVSQLVIIYFLCSLSFSLCLSLSPVTHRLRSGSVLLEVMENS